MGIPATIAEIDLGAVAVNTRALRAAADPSARLMAVVKANAYGHGAAPVSEAALANGADALAVARIEEGILLRQAGISAPILVFGHIPEPDLPDMIAWDLTATAYSAAVARTLSEAARCRGAVIRIHAKIDTGMGRLGFFPEKAAGSAPPEDFVASILPDLIAVSKLPGLELEGIYTHFATSDTPDCPFAASQLRRFLRLLSAVHRAGLEIPIRHAANSGAILHMPESHLDMVRPGISLYGLYPSEDSDRSRVRLEPAMGLKTRIIHLKKVPAGLPVSYGGTYKTPAATLIATVPVGYADGYRRTFSNRGYMLVHGRKAPVVGRVCMDLTLLDVGRIPGVGLNDEVVVFGKQGDATISADDLAGALDTINYEIVTSVSDRIPREYHGGQRPEVRGPS